MSSMLTVSKIQEITKGTIVQGIASRAVHGVSIDSRSIKKGNVFIAIKGLRFNGHRFIPSAIRKGANVVIVSQKVSCPKNITVVSVKDTTKALGQIAAWHRNRFSIPVIAVTGSVGKTTTKEITAAVLAKRYKVLKNVKTENNHFGVPLTLLKLKASHQIVILELGTNQPGDIPWLAQIVRPTTTILTNIGDSHLERLKSRQGVFREKKQIINYMQPHGTIILNNDDPFLKTLLNKNIKHKIIQFGCCSKSGSKATQITLRNNRRLQFNVQRQIYTIHSPAMHNVYNALAAISCGTLYKIRYNEMKTAIARFRFCDGRQEITKYGRYWLIDDTYNANPVSLNSAIVTLNALRVQGKKIIVCADMLELGRQSKTLHKCAGHMIAKSDADVVLTVGKKARYMHQSLHRSNGGIQSVHCRSLNEVHQRLKNLCAPGDAILVKGSRGMHMERTVTYLKKHLN